MSHTSQEPPRVESLAWQRLAYFGANIMGLMGLFWGLLGAIALFDDGFFTYRSNQLLAAESYATWGWVHLIGGLLAVTAAAGILWGGALWARTLGVVMAVLSAVVNLGFLAAAPVWSTMIIGLDVMIVYALTVHGWEIEES